MVGVNFPSGSARSQQVTIENFDLWTESRDEIMPVCVKSEGHFFLYRRVDTAVVRISFSLSLLEVLSRLSWYCWSCVSSFLTAITASPSPRFCRSVYFPRFLHLITSSSFSLSSSYSRSPFFTFRMTFFYNFSSRNTRNNWLSLSTKTANSY